MSNDKLARIERALVSHIELGSRLKRIGRTVPNFARTVKRILKAPEPPVESRLKTLHRLAIGQGRTVSLTLETDGDVDLYIGESEESGWESALMYTRKVAPGVAVEAGIARLKELEENISKES